MAAITDYASLKTEIADTLDRSDLTNAIPGFISLAEAYINRKLRVRAMERRATLDTVSGTRYYALPAGYKSMRHMRLNTTPIQDLEYMTPERLDTKYSSGNTGKPTHYTVVGDEINLAPIPDGVYTMEMAYWKRFDSLSDSNTSNWLITNAPDLLLYASMAAAEIYLKNDPRLPMFIQMREALLNDVKNEDWNDRFGGGAMRVIPDQITP